VLSNPIPLRICILAALSLATVVADARAQGERPSPDGATLGGFVLPTKPLDARCAISANRGWTWKQDDTQRLFLEGDVRFRLGGYSFSSKRALVWINRLPTGASFATQIAVWFERADEPTRRAGLGASGNDLLVTATITGATELSLLLTEERAPGERVGAESADAPRARRAFMKSGESRLARYLRALDARIDAGTQPLVTLPIVDRVPVREEPMPVPGGKIEVSERAPAPAPRPEKKPSAPIFDATGSVSFSAESIAIEERADRIAIQGMVEIEYISTTETSERSLQLSAERAVIFLAPGTLASLKSGKFDGAQRTLDATAVEGIYLEGAVRATDGDYALRGARVYYDLKENRAAIVDAVLRTYDRKRRDLPISVRAAELRQVAADEWLAERASVSTSEFFTPHLAIGVDRVTVTKEPPEAGGGMYIDARGAALEAGGTRVLPLPGYEGPVERIPLRSLEVGFENNRGMQIGTSWDLAALLGRPQVRGVDSELHVDAYTERGVGVGSTFRLSEEFGKGVIDLYSLYDTGGSDRTSSGELVDQDAGLRGIIDADWRTALDPNLTLRAQLAAISDETFVSAWRQQAFNQRREYETSVELLGTSENTSLSLYVKHNLDDFISNSYLLASRGYTVDKLPEFAYQRVGDEPLEGITWTQQWSAAGLALRPTSGTPNSLGVPIGAWGGAIGAGDSIEDAYAAAGYDDGTVARLDTRHELSIPLTNGWATLTPFATGQFTGYIGDSLETYDPDVESLRMQAGGGLRGSMRFVRVDDRAQSRLLDVNRLRHIVEPYSTLWYGWDSNDPGELPIYDQSFEGTSAGTALNLGLRQTLQTQRGGAGAWRSVDWVKLDLGVVLNDESDDFTPEPIDPLNPFSSLRWAQSPIPAFYSFRPELSQWGSHAYGASTWQLSDALTLGGTATYLFEDRDFVTDPDSVLPNLARASLGLEMRHNPVTSTYVEYRYVAPTSTELLQVGLLYEVGKRYLFSVSPQYDLSAGDFRALSGSITRTFPDFDLNADAGYDLVQDQTFIGLSLSIPAGTRASVRNFGIFTPGSGGMR